MQQRRLRLLVGLALAVTTASACGTATGTTAAPPPVQVRSAPPAPCLRIVCEPNADYGQPTLASLQDAQSRIVATRTTSARTASTTTVAQSSATTAGAGTVGPAGPAGATGPAGPAGPASPDFGAVYTKYRNSIAHFSTRNCIDRKFYVGSGFLVAPDLIATAAHVVDYQHIRQIVVNDEEVTGTVIGVDADRDFALVRLTRPVSAEVVPLATDWPAVGSPLAVLGYALGGPLSMQQGHVAATDVSVDSVPGWLETDTADDEGSSGGPSFDATGKAVGIVSFSAGQVGLVHLEVSSLTASRLIKTWKATPEPGPTC